MSNGRTAKVAMHWIVVALLIFLSVELGMRLDKESTWIRLRYRAHRYVQKLDFREVVDVERTALVLIDDEEYWKGDLARRVPIKRTYLARLLRTLDAAEPAIIALDFDLRSPTPDGSLVDHIDYRKETAELISAIRDVSRRRPIVLPANLGRDSRGNPKVESAIYRLPELPSENVRFGYIELPFDLRQVPMPVRIGKDEVLDSLATAVVRLENERALRFAKTGKDSLPYGSFAKPEAFTSLLAKDVFRASPEALKRKLGHKIVIVGAGWSRLAYRRGGTVDAALSPIGVVGKVYLHSNYIEALLDQRTYKPLGKKITIGIEVIFAMIVAIFFSLRIRPLLKLACFATSCALLFVVAYIFYQNFGLFFDFLIPLILLGLHASVEQILEWRKMARRYWKLEHASKPWLRGKKNASPLQPLTKGAPEMRTLIIFFLLVPAGQSLWAFSEEKKPNPAPPEVTASSPTKVDGGEVTDENEEDSGSHINIDDPGGPPAAYSDQGDLPDTASILPLIGLLGLLFSGTALAMWVRRTRTVKMRREWQLRHGPL